MRVALPIWDERVSPVFDVASRLLVVDLEGGREVYRTEAALDEPEAGRRAQRLAQLNIDLLICGAISTALEAMLASAGIDVTPQTCGPVEEVLKAFVHGRLTGEAFLMPGACDRRRVRRGHGSSRADSKVRGDRV